MAGEVAEGSARCVERGLAAAVAGELGAMDADELAVEIGNGGDECWPGLRQPGVVRPMVSVRVEPERGAVPKIRNATVPQTRFCESARNRLCACEQVSGGSAGIVWTGCPEALVKKVVPAGRR